MNGNTFSFKALKEYFKKFVATLVSKFLTNACPTTPKVEPGAGLLRRQVRMLTLEIP